MRALTSVLTGLGIELKVHPGDPDEIDICCLFCTDRGRTDDTEFKLGLNLKSGEGHCFRCGWAAKRNAWVHILDKLEYDSSGVFLTEEEDEVEDKKAPVVEMHWPDDFTRVKSSDKSKFGRRVYNYLRGRGLTENQIIAKKIGYCMAGRYAFRVVIPVLYKGKLEGLIGRAMMEDQEPRYLNSKGIKVLYNIPERAGRKGKDCILVEGAFDALAIERAVDSNYVAGAILGHDLTEKQIKMLKGFKRIILWCDPDKPGITGFLNMYEKLKEEKFEVLFVMIKRGEPDPADTAEEKITKRIRLARPYSDAIHNYILSCAVED